ncbi:MAG: hypothetical protein SO003_06220, partial [Candidatus Borkfalkiaceae bacterium]|nr:hypothetical protein [Christensenellaceae bacterium]
MSTIIKIKADDIRGNGKIIVIGDEIIKKVILSVKERNTAREFSFEFCGEGQTCKGAFGIKKPQIWSVNTPCLYDYAAKIITENSSETLSGSFGFRSLSTDGKNVCLNGTPVFIRGYIRGATAHDHSNNCGLTKEEFYRKNIRAAKKYGFNLVRFHSVVPDEEFFRVADEEGLLVHIEMRLPDDIYNNLREMQTSG